MRRNNCISVPACSLVVNLAPAVWWKPCSQASRSTTVAISPVGAEVRVELEADWLAKPWLATVRHADFERLHMRRGQRLFAHPRQWHRFKEDAKTPEQQAGTSGLGPASAAG